MSDSRDEEIRYRRARFFTRLPAGHRYARSHYWLVEEEPGVWRVGFTRFATRMLGDFVELGWEVKPGTQVEEGQAIGWVEGFKALSELYSVMGGEFLGGNPAIDEDTTLVDKDGYYGGWLYRVRGEPEDTLDVHGYIAFLDETIDRVKEQYGDA